MTTLLATTTCRSAFAAMPSCALTSGSLGRAKVGGRSGFVSNEVHPMWMAPERQAFLSRNAPLLPKPGFGPGSNKDLYIVDTPGGGG